MFSRRKVYVQLPKNFVQPPKNFVQPPESLCSAAGKLCSAAGKLEMTIFYGVLAFLTGNFWSDFLPNDKLGWDEILQEGRKHSNASPCQKLDKPTSRISRKMWIGFRLLWSFSRKPCTGLSWNFPRLFFLTWCFFPKNFRKNKLKVCKITLNKILHFCKL